MNTSNRAVLTFYTNAGNVVTLSIPRARMDKTADQARASMEALLDSNTIITSNGTPRTIRGAKLVQTIREILV
jgi:uncharacterized protein YccT (UPF0319 family)